MNSSSSTMIPDVFSHVLFWLGFITNFMDTGLHPVKMLLRVQNIDRSYGTITVFVADRAFKVDAPNVIDISCIVDGTGEP